MSEEEEFPTRARRAREGRSDRDFRPVSPLRRMAAEAMEEPVAARPMLAEPSAPGRPWRLWILGGLALIFALLATAEWRRAVHAERAALAGAARSPAASDAASEAQALADVLRARDLKVAVLATPAAPAPVPVSVPRKGRKAARPAQKPASAPAPQAIPGDAKVLWDPARRTGVLRAAGLPPAPAGQEYVLWIKIEGAADAFVAAGSFPPLSGEGVSLHRFRGSEAEGRATGFAISLERADATVAPAAPGTPGHPRGRIAFVSDGLR